MLLSDKGKLETLKEASLVLHLSTIAQWEKACLLLQQEEFGRRQEELRNKNRELRKGF